MPPNGRWDLIRRLKVYYYYYYYYLIFISKNGRTSLKALPCFSVTGSFSETHAVPFYKTVAEIHHY